MKESLITCLKCGGDACSEITNEVVTIWICMGCGFTSNNTITDANVTEMEATLPELYKALRFKDKDGNIRKEWTGIPIIAANMDTIGTIEMYKVLSTYKMITCFHKHYELEDFENVELDNNYYAITDDVNTNRINVEIEDDKIVKTSIG